MQKVSKLLALLVVTAGCSTETAKKIKDKILDVEGCAADSKCGRSGAVDAQGKPRSHDEIERSGLYLRQFESCADVEQAIEKRIISYLYEYTEQQIENYKRYTSISYDSAAGDAETVASASPSNAASADKSSSPSEYSTTNNQVEGVEESDILKNTGTHIFHASGRNVHIAKSWPANEMKNVHTLKFDGFPRNLLLVDERTLVVLVEHHSYMHYGDLELDTGAISPSHQNVPQMELFQYDVSDPSSPKLVEKFRVKGRYLTMRRIDQTIKLIVADNNIFPEKMVWPSPYGYTSGLSGERRMSSKAGAAKAWGEFKESVKQIESMDLSFWLDESLVQRGDSQNATSVGDQDSCKKVFMPEAPANWGRTHIVTINLQNSDVDRITLLADVQQAYASKKSLYLTTPYYWWFGNTDQDDHTYVHAFDLVDLDTTNYLGSGFVKGQLINQFAMDEYEDSLRVASTVNRWGRRGSSFSQVSVLQLKESSLKEVSEIAKGEAIQSVRFLGKRGFVVTFERIDPLFTLDLSSPTEPKIVGELKIPGFSTYMHPLDENHLLAIGQNGNNWGATRGMKLSIFDVSDFSNPKESHVMQIDSDLYSEAAYNHLAFNYFAPQKTLALPLSGWKREKTGEYSYDYLSKLQLIRIDVDAGFTQLGDVVMVDTTAVTTPNRTAYATANTVERSVFADDVVYAVSGVGIQAVNLQNPGVALGKLTFECDKSCFENWYW